MKPKILRGAMPLVLIVSQVVIAQLRPIPDSLPKLFDSSSVVLSGRVTKVEDNGARDAIWNARAVQLRTYIAEVLVEHVYKGEGSISRIQLRFERPDGNICSVSICEGANVGERDLFFLVNHDGSYQFISPTTGKFQISALSSSGTAGGLRRLKNDLAAGLDDGEATRRLINIRLLGAMQDPEYVPELLAALTHESDPANRAAAYVSLLQLAGRQYLREALLEAQSPSSTQQEQAFKSNICDLVAQIRDPSAVEVLRDFAASKSDEARASAIHALRSLGSPETVPLFVRSLDDKVWSVRYDAVLALAFIEKNWELAPAVDTFRANEPKYISAWKSWWETEGKSHYASN